MHNILVVYKTRSYLVMSVEEQLKKMDYNMIEVEAKISDISNVNEDIAAILLYVEPELSEDTNALVFLRDKAVEEDIPFFVMGDSNDIDDIRNIIPTHAMQKEFPRPIDVRNVVIAIDEYVKNQGKHTKKKILVVDDSGAMLRNVKGWLEERYQVILANSGAMAIKYLALNRPDLVLLDYEMPVVNGKQVLEMIRTESEFSDIPVIFLTSKNDRESITQVMSLKPEGYLLKTMKPSDIVKNIDEFFEKRKRL
ncbi:MAG: response regulator [Roseburia sp.]|nr:response regulator [Roseburia sp.]